MNIKKIIKMTKRYDGFTITQKGNFTTKRKGYFVSVTNHTAKEINERIFNKTISEAKELPKAYIGFWRGDKNYLDVSVHTNNIDEAFNIAKSFKQKAIFDCSTMSEIYV